MRSERSIAQVPGLRRRQAIPSSNRQSPEPAQIDSRMDLKIINRAYDASEFFLRNQAFLRTKPRTELQEGRFASICDLVRRKRWRRQQRGIPDGATYGSIRSAGRGS